MRASQLFVDVVSAVDGSEAAAQRLTHYHTIQNLKEKPFTRDIKGTLLGAIFEATRLRQILLHERAHSEVVAAAKKLIPATVVRTDYPTGEDSPTSTTHTLAHTHLVTLSTPAPLGTLRPRKSPFLGKAFFSAR